MMNEDKIIKTLEKLPFILEQNKIEGGNKIDTKNEIINSMEKGINKMGEEIENVKRTSADIDILNLITSKILD